MLTGRPFAFLFLAPDPLCHAVLVIIGLNLGEAALIHRLSLVMVIQLLGIIARYSARWYCRACGALASSVYKMLEGVGQSFPAPLDPNRCGGSH